MNTSELISICLSAGALAFSLLSFFRVARHDQKKDTLDAFNVLQVQALDHLTKHPPQWFKEAAQNNCSEDYREISRYMARIEHFSTGVQTGIYDRKVAYALAKGFLNKAIYIRLEPFLRSKNELGNYYDNYIALVKWMNTKEVNDHREENQ